MSVPTYDQFIEPILRYLIATPEGATARNAHETDALKLVGSTAPRGNCQLG
jgi:restriction system protein